MISIDWVKAGHAVSDAMLKSNWSSNTVAKRAGVDRKTVDRLRRGEKVRFSTLSYIEQALEISIIAEQTGGFDTRDLRAPTELGGYSKENYDVYIGTYYMFRNSYDYEERVICSLFEIVWDYDSGCLAYRELQDNKREDGRRFEYSFLGKVSIPPGLSITQFIGSAGKGFSRVITASSLRGSGPEYFKGILLGINELSDIGYYPASSPVYIEKTDVPALSDSHDGKIGSFPSSKLWHASACLELRSVTENYSAFH